MLSNFYAKIKGKSPKPKKIAPLLGLLSRASVGRRRPLNFQPLHRITDSVDEGFTCMPSWSDLFSKLSLPYHSVSACMPFGETNGMEILGSDRG